MHRLRLLGEPERPSGCSAASACSIRCSRGVGVHRRRIAQARCRRGADDDGADLPRFTARLFTAAQVFPTISMAAQVLLTALAVGDDTYEPCPAYLRLRRRRRSLPNRSFRRPCATSPRPPVKGGDAAVGPRRHRRVQRQRPVERRLRAARQEQAGLRPAAAERPRPHRVDHQGVHRHAALRARDAGTVGLDDELATHLPGFSMRYPYGTAGKATSATSRATSPASRARCPGHAPSISTSAPRATSSRTCAA